MTPTALYKAFGAFEQPAQDDPALAHIPAELRHLAVPIDRVRLDPNNVNKHPASQLEVLKAMLTEFGQRQLLVVRSSTGMLEAGEGRILAGRALGWGWVAVLPCDDDPITALRFALGDNRSARLAEVDEEALALQLLVLRDEGSDLASIGWQRAIRNSSRRGEIVFDGFGGSGTTLLAAHQLGRRARLVELMPVYCDVIVRRAVALGLTAVIHRPGVGELAWEDPR